MSDQEIVAQWQHLAAARDLIATIHGELDADQHRLRSSVGGLLGGSWHGSAATSYREGWTEWTSSADVVLTSLETMGHLVDGVLRGFQQTDDGIGGNVDHIRHRLGPA